MQLYLNLFWDHLRRHMTIYIFTSLLFLTGIIFGAILVNSMNFVQKEALYFHLERFFTLLNQDEHDVTWQAILKGSWLFHVKYMIFFFLIGLTIIGLPVLWVLLFVKGLVIGFSVGFLVNQLGMKGLVIATLSIAPQNMITIPVYIIAGSLAMLFSITLMQKLFVRTVSQSIMRPMGQYVVAFIILLVCLFASALVETFIATESFKAFIKSSFYN